MEMWGNLPQQNQTTAEQPDPPPPNFSVNLQTGKSLHLHGNVMIRNTHTHTQAEEIRRRSKLFPTCMVKKKAQQLQQPKCPYRAHALHELVREHPGHDPGVPMYTATTVCEWGRQRDRAHLWPSLTAQDWRREHAQKARKRKINRSQALGLP